MKVIIACGGTGGHLFPGIAVAQSLRRGGAQVSLLVSGKDIDRQAAQAGHGIAIEVIPGIGSPGALSAAWLPFGIQFASAVKRCIKIYRQFRPDVVLGMGGFTSAPPIVAARLLKIPSVIHESNAIPGRANEWSSRWATAVAVGFAECASFFPEQKVLVTGTPVREGLKRSETYAARRELGLEPGRATILIMGGSQGAHGINAGLMATLPRLETLWKTVQFIHLCGEKDVEWIRNVYASQQCVARVESFLKEMDLAYSAASLVISRAGASSLAEIGWFGLPSILIPYPQAAADHQLHNARIFEKSCASMIVEESQLKEDALALAIRGLLVNELLCTSMAEAARKLAVPDAAERVAALVTGVGETGKIPATGIKDIRPSALNEQTPQKNQTPQEAFASPSS